MRNVSSGNLVISLVAAGFTLAVVMMMMSTLQPVIEEISAIVAPLVSDDGEWGVELADIIIGWLPVVLPLVAFFAVLVLTIRRGKAG